MNNAAVLNSSLLAYKEAEHVLILSFIHYIRFIH